MAVRKNTVAKKHIPKPTPPADRPVDYSKLATYPAKVEDDSGQLFIILDDQLKRLFHCKAGDMIIFNSLSEFKDHNEGTLRYIVTSPKK